MDVDEDQNGRVEYHLASGNEQGHFLLNSHRGTLTVASPLDREKVAVKVAVIRTIVFSFDRMLT